MAYIASISYGKGSLAMLEAIHLLGLPLDRVITVQEWAAPGLPAVLPEVADFQGRMDRAISQRWGLAVEHIRSPWTFEELFYTPCGKHSARAGSVRGWPFQRGCWVNGYLKTEPFRKAVSTSDVQYLGIAADEAERIWRHRRKPNVRLPLVEIGWTEQDCMDWCREHEMLSPVYSSFARDGCWFCMNQPVERLRWLRREYPKLWAMMLRWDADSPARFKPHCTVAMLERRFAAEDAGLVPADRRFRWEMIGEKQLDYAGKQQ